MTRLSRRDATISIGTAFVVVEGTEILEIGSWGVKENVKASEMRGFGVRVVADALRVPRGVRRRGVDDFKKASADEELLDPNGRTLVLLRGEEVGPLTGTAMATSPARTT